MRRDIQTIVVVCILMLVMLSLAIGTSFADAAGDMNQAQAQFIAKDYDSAIRTAQGVISSEPMLTSKALFLIGQCCQEKNDYPKAIEAFSNFLTTYATSEPEARYALKELSKSYAVTKAWDNAIQVAEGAIGKYPMDAAYWVRRIAYLNGDKGDRAKQAEMLKRLMQEFPNAPEAQNVGYDLAEVLFMQGKNVEACAVLDSIIEDNPDIASRIFNKKSELMCKYMQKCEGPEAEERAYWTNRTTTYLNILAAHPDGGSACIMLYPCPVEAPVETHFCISNPGCKTKTKLH